jgi:hypothetical protein
MAVPLNGVTAATHALVGQALRSGLQGVTRDEDETGERL